MILLDINYLKNNRYIYYYYFSSFKCSLCPSAPTVLDGSMEKAEVTDLYPWMEYQFRIIATNEHGSGEASIPSLKIKTWDARKDKKEIEVVIC